MFWAYLQGMETDDSIRRDKTGCLVLSLPTRNGNHSSPQATAFLIRCFEPTYKEWKRFCSNIIIDNNFRFWAYLQGMETVVLPGNRVVKFVSFWAYLQGMETFLNVLFLESLSLSFEPTYKEWKLIKHIKIYPLFRRVLSLPTRNGNFADWSS